MAEALRGAGFQSRNFSCTISVTTMILTIGSVTQKRTDKKQIWNFIRPGKKGLGGIL
jgi:hypothetical protein